MEDILDEGMEDEVVEILEPQPQGGALKRQKKETKIDPVAISMYGEGNFDGYMKVGELVEMIPAFKEFYYAEKIKEPNCHAFQILKDFNATACYPEGKKFHPYPNQYRTWRKKWDLDIMNQRSDKDVVIFEPKKVKQVIKTRNEDRELVLGTDYGELEKGATTLAGELINDAAQMLRDDQDLDEIYDTDELIKRRTYIVNVLAHTTRLVHGKAALLLKASQEKRENANFMMNLIAKATSGNLSDEEMGMLETTYSKPPTQNEPAHI